MTVTLALALVAGMLSTLSPCVLPILPVILASASGESRYGPLALAAGLAISFAALGLMLALLGQSISFDGSHVRVFAGLVMMLLGLTLAIPVASEKFASAAAPVGHWAEARFGGIATSGLKGQFALGALLAALWSPCTGPTLGAASLLAAQGKDIAQSALTMLAFGTGAALPLVLLGMLSREAMLRWRGKLLSAGKNGKATFGAVLVLIGFLVMTGIDKNIEAALVAHTPDWLTQLTTRF